jgi:hypothetical protein
MSRWARLTTITVTEPPDVARPRHRFVRNKQPGHSSRRAGAAAEAMRVQRQRCPQTNPQRTLFAAGQDSQPKIDHHVRN